MPTPWLKRIKKTGKLTVFNKAGTWSGAVDAAIISFNKLSLGVELVPEKEEKSANIVVTLANGAAKYTYYGDTAQTKSDFKADKLHGQASTFTDKKKNEIFFAVIFLPGKVKKVTADQKEIIIVHEFLHAAGLNGLNDAQDDHEISGIMNGIMKQDQNGGLIEYLAEKDVKPMPPIRIGGQTACKMRMLWADAKSCKD